MRLAPVLLLSLSLCVPSFAASPSHPHAGPDFSGTYACKGDDSHEGPYTSTVTLQKIPEHSPGRFGAYSLSMDVPGYGTYLGHVAADGRVAAVHFALTDPAPKDHGTGLARFEKDPSGKWRFDKFYYEPEFKGGNHGTESCVQQ